MDANSGTEQQQLREKLWVFAQRGVVLLVAMGIGFFIGYIRWGEAATLREQVTQLEEKVAIREKERDTLKSQMAIIDRDKKETEKQLQELQARCAEKIEAPAPEAAVPGQP
jgi:hypothetical protein